MADTEFIPYWRTLSSGSGPNSWIFFVLTKVDGRHRPLAAISSTGSTSEEESLHGPRLVACCQRILTILSDPVNHTAIRSEMALAPSYFTADADGAEPVELPELNRKRPYEPQRFRQWNRESIPPFPFITAAVLQGIGFDPVWGANAPTRPESLATVWRGDTDIEWGMVVFDITELGLRSADRPAVRYGIVGFRVGMAKFVPSREADFIPFQGASFQGEEGPLRVIEKVRPRRAMSAAEYMAKFEYETLLNEYTVSQYNRNMSCLAPIQLVEDEALSMVWPKGYDDYYLPVTGTSVTTEARRGLKDYAIRSIIQETGFMDDLDVSILNEVCSLPGFVQSLRQNLLKYSEKIGNTRAAGRLLQLAFLQDGHLGLEELKNITPGAILGALEDGTTTSLSFCIDCVRGTPAQLASSLSQFRQSLREVYLLQSPSRESDALSVEIFRELAAQPTLLSSIDVMFAGAYSAALRKRFWLPTSSNLVPLHAFPVQQIFIRQKWIFGSRVDTYYDYIYLGDGLLKPEHFAAGFLVWLHTLTLRDDLPFGRDTSPTFGFSSAPASLATDPVSTARVSPILCESLALPLDFPDNSYCCPRARNLEPGGWSVVVLQDTDPTTEAGDLSSIRHAFVRALKRPISVESPPTTPLGPDELEVLSLEDFISTTLPDINPELFGSRQAVIRSQPVMSHSEASAVLSECLYGVEGAK